MGESKRKREVALATEQAMVVDTLGGRMHVRWDEGAQATCGTSERQAGSGDKDRKSVV